MSALVIDLRPVRNALEQSQRMGMPESRQAVVERVVSDIKHGHHPYAADQQLQAQRPSARQDGAA